MRVLILGGSWFLGSAITAVAVHRGHHVTLFNRGISQCSVSTATRICGDWERKSDVDRLASAGPWDVAIDVAGVIPRLVGHCAKVLAPLVDRYVFVSTISVYMDWPHKPVDENSPLWEDADPECDPGTRAWDPDAYGPLKVGCEMAIRQQFGTERVSIVRPHVVLGPGEYVGRLPWWLSRTARGGRVLVPAPDRSIQPIDVRDVAAFVVDRAQAATCAVFNVAAPAGRETFSGLFDACRAATGSDAVPLWVDEDWLIARGVSQWTELPMWRALPTAWSMVTDRAQAEGLRCRPLSDTVNDTWAWMCSGNRAVEHQRAGEHGITAERERSLLVEWDRLRRSGCGVPSS
ncbi:reductase [Nocardia sp. CA-107356]|uniref:reductase n=1 Tax=Nocardia sp. CA-107356 TaxID=3239972 RepID=UPI003D92927E